LLHSSNQIILDMLCYDIRIWLLHLPLQNPGRVTGLQLHD
jgi:hypothetical protein